MATRVAVMSIIVGEFLLQSCHYIRLAGQGNQQFFHSIHSFGVSISRHGRSGKEENALDKQNLLCYYK